MISKMQMNRRTVFQSGSAGAAWPHGVLPTFLLALLGTGCGERFELGEVGQNLDPGDGGGELSLPLLADGVEDADARVEEGFLALPMGDVDGDGFDDWLDPRRLWYGRARHPEGVLATPETRGPLFTLGYDAEAHSVWPTAERAGDINGDGYGDIVFRTYGYEPDHSEERWAHSRAYLWYGGPERTTGSGVLDEVAVPFPTPDDLPSHFDSELTGGQSGDEVEFQANQAVKLTPLGDIDGDGYDDLAWTASFSATPGRSESVTYVFYGSADLLTSNAAPAARLPGVSELRAIGDVNGDGFTDMQAVAGAATRALAGSAQRLSGELESEEMGMPMVDAAQYRRAERIGDIDKDGYDDLFALWEADGESARHYLFYGSPSLLAGPLEKSAASAMFAVHGPFAEFSPGDWDGDGDTDILLNHARIITDQFSPIAGAEIRLIPGDAERYSGVHNVSVHRPDATIDDDDNIWFASIPGDIDGDGFADAFLLAYRQRTFVKYGSPLSTPIY